MSDFMELWEKLERIMTPGDDKAYAATLRRKAKDTTGDIRSVSQIELYRIYNTAAQKRPLLAPVFRRFANRHLREALRSAETYPDPLSLDAALLQRKGDFWGAAKEFEEVIARQRAWIEIFKDPDGSRQLSLCVDLAAAGGGRSMLGQFDQALFWFMEALKEFNQLPLDVRTAQASIEDIILGGILRSLLSQFKYEDALFFLERALEGEMFSAYQSDVRREMRAQKELLPELVKRTQGYTLPEEGLKLWANLMEEVQRCENPEQARGIRRKIFDTIDRHKAAAQIRDLEDAIVGLLRRNYSNPASQPKKQASEPRPTVDLSGIAGPEWRAQLEKLNRAIEALRRDSEKRVEEIAKMVASINKAMNVLNDGTIEQVHKKASEIYRVPGWFRMQWNTRALARVAVQFLAIEFLIGKVIEKLLESSAPSVLERLHFSLSEGLIAASVALLLFFLSMPAEKKIDDLFLESYKRLLQKLVADRVTTYWVTYNALLRIFAGCKAEMDKLKNKLQGNKGEIPLADEKAS